MEWWCSDPETQDYFLQAFASGELKFCVGSCGRILSKIDGCNHVQCPTCQTEMCWICNKKKYGDGCNDLTHNSH